MKKRRQAGDAASTEPFLRALATHQDGTPGEQAAEPDAAPMADPELVERLRVAEGALRQLREDSEQRIEEARSAIAQERDRRERAESELAQLRGEPQSRAEEPRAEEPPGDAPEPRRRDTSVFSPGPDAAPLPAEPAPAEGASGGWPSPWLGDAGSQPPRRRRFGGR